MLKYAILLTVIYFFKTISSLFSFLKWRKKDVVSGQLGVCKSYTTSKKAMTCYHDLTINYQGETITLDFVIVKKDGDKSTIKPGDYIDIYYDPKTKEYAPVQSTKESILRNLYKTGLSFFAIIVLLGITIAISANKGE